MDFSALFGLMTSGAGVLAGRTRKGGAREAWQTAAEAHGLLHKPDGFWSGPKLSGSLSGNELKVDIKNRNTASVATRFRLAMPPLGLGLKLRKKGFWNSFRPRVVTGDRAFDNQVVAEGRNHHAVGDFLTPERRGAIQSFLSSFKGAALTDDEISITTRGYVKNSDEILGAIDAMRQVASVLAEKGRSPSVSQSKAVPAAAIAVPGIVAAAAPELEPGRSPPPAPEARPAPEHELASELEAEFESAPELAPSKDSERVDALAEGPARVDAPAEDPDERNGSDRETSIPSASIDANQRMTGVEEFCATVFAPGMLSFAANQKFKESYEGKRVVWTGTLESITPYTFDFDFGSGRGIKAVLTILESETVGSRDVQAVVGLPPDTESLDDRIGKPAEFTGRLLKVDGLGRRVMVADGELRP